MDDAVPGPSNAPYTRFVNPYHFGRTEQGYWISYKLDAEINYDVEMEKVKNVRKRAESEASKACKSDVLASVNGIDFEEVYRQVFDWHICEYLESLVEPQKSFAIGHLHWNQRLCPREVVLKDKRFGITHNKKCFSELQGQQTDNPGTRRAFYMRMRRDAKKAEIFVAPKGIISMENGQPTVSDGEGVILPRQLNKRANTLTKQEIQSQSYNQQSVENASSSGPQRLILCSKVTCFKDSLENFNKKMAKGCRYICISCGGLWFEDSTLKITNHSLEYALDKYSGKKPEFREQILFLQGRCRSDNGLLHTTDDICKTCCGSAVKGSIPRLSLHNVGEFHQIPPDLQDLTPLEERMVALRSPFMQIRTSVEHGKGGRVDGQYHLKGNVINIFHDLNKLTTVLPKKFSETDTMLLGFFRKLEYKNPYAFETVRPFRIHNSAEYLVKTELYIEENIKLSSEWAKFKPSDKLDFNPEEENETEHGDDLSDCAHLLQESEPKTDENQRITAEVNIETDFEPELQEDNVNPGGDETMITREDTFLGVKFAPGEGEIPKSTLKDTNFEER